MSKINTPILFIVFNRPDTTIKVFDSIRRAKPAKIYIAGDAPRPDNNEDKKNCALVREITSQIDWKCEVKTRFPEKNQGCGPGPFNAISWIFETEDRAIILEDDCVPAQSFFTYCDELLEKYKDDQRVWTISGNNYYEEIKLPNSYIFSNYGQSWGWATWKRCWQQIDMEMKNFLPFMSIGGFKNVMYSKREVEYFDKFYSTIAKDKNLFSHVWDVQASFSIRSNRGLSIVPSKNLVKNIGLQGTHSSEIGKYHNIPIDEAFAIENHPLFIIPYVPYDNYCFYKHYLLPRKFSQRIKRKIQKTIKMVTKH
jgi:hypothetical protein